MGKYVDENEVMKRGRFKGEPLEEVVVAEPEYLTWLLEECELEAEEREMIQNYV